VEALIMLNLIDLLELILDEFEWFPPNRMATFPEFHNLKGIPQEKSYLFSANGWIWNRPNSQLGISFFSASGIVLSFCAIQSLPGLFAISLSTPENKSRRRCTLAGHAQTYHLLSFPAHRTATAGAARS